MNQIEIYQTKHKRTEIEVRFEEDTVWLSLNQIAELFRRDKSVISRHFHNIYKEKELVKKATVAKNATVQIESGRRVLRNIEYYNLDAIISVGYRVNSKRGTQFRQWATQRLKDYLVKGYILNEKRLQQLSSNLLQLEKAVKLIQQSGNSDNLQLSEAKGLLEILTNYTQSFVILNKFDSNNLEAEQLNENITYEIKYAKRSLLLQN